MANRLTKIDPTHSINKPFHQARGIYIHMPSQGLSSPLQPDCVYVFNYSRPNPPPKTLGLPLLGQFTDKCLPLPILLSPSTLRPTQMGGKYRFISRSRRASMAKKSHMSESNSVHKILTRLYDFYRQRRTYPSPNKQVEGTAVHRHPES
jgi:hypothetical protein